MLDKNKIVSILGIIALAFLFVIGPIIFTGLGMSLAGAFLLSCVVSLVIIFGGPFLFYKIDMGRYQRHQGEIYYHLDINYISITARNSYVATGMTAMREKVSSLNYNPASITFSATSIGAVTRGGIDVNPESLSVGSSIKTDKYHLNYGSTYNPIYTIELSDALAEEAKKDAFISTLLVGNKLVLRNSVSKSFVKNMTSTSKPLEVAAAEYNLAMQNTPISKLSKSECYALIDWLAGK